MTDITEADLARKARVYRTLTSDRNYSDEAAWRIMNDPATLRALEAQRNSHAYIGPREAGRRRRLSRVVEGSE